MMDWKNDNDKEHDKTMDEAVDKLEQALDGISKELEKKIKKKEKERKTAEDILDILFTFAPKDDVTDCFKTSRQINKKLNLILRATTIAGNKNKEAELPKKTSKFYLELEGLIDQFMKYAEIDETKEEPKDE